jgi:aspartate/glutamate racemase
MIDRGPTRDRAHWGMRGVGFLHTSSIHVATFDRLVDELAPGTPVTHLVDESLLARARDRGDDHPIVVGGVLAALDGLAAAGVDTIVCTCSTIGAVAEALGPERPGIRVVRVDRPMAVEAVDLAAAGTGRILVVAALRSTVAPTCALIRSVAADRGTDVVVEVTVVEGAWERFEAGDAAGYVDAVAAALSHGIDSGDGSGAFDAVVLAQASMAAAADRVAVEVPVLSSPRPAVRSVLG